MTTRAAGISVIMTLVVCGTAFGQTIEDTVVTGYTTQRRADITGAVATVNVTGLSRQTSTSMLQRLDGRVPGVTVVELHL